MSKQWSSIILSKLKCHIDAADKPVSYTLNSNEAPIQLNSLLGLDLRICFSKNIYCVKCARKISKTFSDGYCYPCFKNSPETAPCIIRPEVCQAHLGLGRDPEWEETHHNQPHIVYFSFTSHEKVGVTRSTQVPTRWIDQGASFALIIAKIPYRHLAGRMEIELKKYMSDRTQWQGMLRAKPTSCLLNEKYKELTPLLPPDLHSYLTPNESVLSLHYPLIKPLPEKIKSVNLSKLDTLSGILIGIKGQYLLFDNGQVFNVRKHSGYDVSLQIN